MTLLHVMLAGAPIAKSASMFQYVPLIAADGVLDVEEVVPQQVVAEMLGGDAVEPVDEPLGHAVIAVHAPYREDAAGALSQLHLHEPQPGVAREPPV